MAALIIPDDSYVSLEDANQYHAMRTSALEWEALDDETKQRRLVSASDFLDANYHFMGEKSEFEQLRAFPRNGSDAIPKAVKFAVCELALQEGLNQNEEAKMESVSVGPVKVAYQQGSQGANSSIDRFVYVKALLNEVLAKSTGQVTLLRG
ncbi:DnaT-like ssDNA-binding protein [Avibacterium volantium]|uniref:DnaT-like ssDNA-binding protein n=1 Tax=Avibacterium volantium TaxID=762 RepID=UPI003BF918E5